MVVAALLEPPDFPVDDDASVAVADGTKAVIGTVPVAELPLTRLPLVLMLPVTISCPPPVDSAFFALNGAGVITVV